jgi:hypothetical protein
MAFSRLEKAMAAIIGIDILAPGFSRSAAKKAVSLIARGAPPVARTTLAIPGAPQALGAGLGYAALQTDPGQSLLAAAAEHGRQSRIRVERAVQDALALAPIRRKKRMSKFNASVKRGMAIIKASTHYGKRGTINAPRKAFTAVTKTVSKVKQGKATPKTGILKKVAASARKRFKGLGLRGLA